MVLVMAVSKRIRRLRAWDHVKGIISLAMVAAALTMIGMELIKRG